MRSLVLLHILLLGLLVACGSAETSTQTASQTALVRQTTLAAQETPAPSPTIIAVTAVPPSRPTIAPPMPTAQPVMPTQAMLVGDAATAQQVIADRAQEVVETLQQRDLQKLAELVHPQKGLRFSPYAAVSEQQLVFTAEQIASMDADPTLYTWGTYDGIGLPIELTFAEYISRFVYSHDFAEAERVGFNEFLGKGNTNDNSRSFYGPDAIIVEYHFPGFDPIYQGMDWVSLRVVFEQIDQQWYVSGLIHDQWTI